MTKWEQIRTSEPVRLWVYPLLLAALGLAVKNEVIDTDLEGLIQLALLSLLGVGGVETARAKVSPAVPTAYTDPRSWTVEDWRAQRMGRHELDPPESSEPPTDRW